MCLLQLVSGLEESSPYRFSSLSTSRTSPSQPPPLVEHSSILSIQHVDLKALSLPLVDRPEKSLGKEEEEEVAYARRFWDSLALRPSLDVDKRGE